MTLTNSANAVKATTSGDELETPIAVLKDSGNKVVVSINVPGIIKRKGFFFKLCLRIRKHTSPFHLAENAKFGTFSLTESSLNFLADVYDSKQTMKVPGSTHLKYTCRITQFPSRINPESAEFELYKAPSGECYFLLTCVKIDNYQTNWKEFLATHGTIDLAKLHQSD